MQSVTHKSTSSFAFPHSAHRFAVAVFAVTPRILSPPTITSALTQTGRFSRRFKPDDFVDIGDVVRASRALSAFHDTRRVAERRHVGLQICRVYDRQRRDALHRATGTRSGEAIAYRSRVL